MTDMEKVIRLYTLMAERLEKSETGANQARVYRETIAFMKDCATVDEATEKLKHSQYYLAPSIALTEDTIGALRRAAQEDGMDDLVAVYDKKLQEIASDGNAIYDAGYLETAKHMKAAYYTTMESFAQLFQDYLSLVLANPKDEAELSHAERQIRYHLGFLKKPSSDFGELSKLPSFRKLVPCADSLYEEFVAAIRQFSVSGIRPEPVAKDLGVSSSDAENAWKEIEASFGEIDAAGKEYVSKIHEAKVQVIAPDTADGVYTYNIIKVR